MGCKKEVVVAKKALSPSGKEDVPYHTLSIEEVLKEVQVDQALGLSAEAVAERQARLGLNKLTAKEKPGILAKIWDQLTNVLILVLAVAGAISYGFKDYVDGTLIVIVITLNVAVGVIQEGDAEKAAEAIARMLSQKASVKRGGRDFETIEADQLVPGDIIRVVDGDKLPADVRFLNVSKLKVLESMLTGESQPIEKNLTSCEAKAPLGDRKGMGFSGTNVTQGQAEAVVVQTGDFTELGKINTLVQDADEGETPLVRQLDRFGMFIALLTLVIAIVVFLVAYLARKMAVHESFAAAIAIAVAIIPEGLPSMVSVTLAKGVQNMAKQKAIVKSLPIVEGLGSVTVICTDKTGTLTKNEMTVIRCHTSGGAYSVSGVGYAPKGSILDAAGAPVSAETLAKLRLFALGGVVCSTATLGPDPEQVPAGTPDEQVPDHCWKPGGDPTEVALLTLSKKIGQDIKPTRDAVPALATIPFSSVVCWMASMHDVTDASGAKRRIVFVKGGWDRVIALCATQSVGDDIWASEPCNKQAWLDTASGYSSNGERVLAYASMVVPGDKAELTEEDIMAGRLQMNGLVSIQDPVRDGVREAIAECKTAGVVVKMITGDHFSVARHIGGSIGLRTEKVLSGEQIENMSDAELSTHVQGCDIYARVAPEHKLRIVRELQRLGEICAMTGDGVNDSPALRQAEVGCAMGITGTDVAKEAAKIILSDDSFPTLAGGVKEGRVVYDNLKKVIIFSLPTNLAQGISVAIALFIGIPGVVLTPVQVLYINMITSVTLGISCGLERAEPGIMEKPPRNKDEPIMSRYVSFRSIFATAIFVAFMLGNYQWCINTGAGEAAARSACMNTLVICQCLYAFNCRFLSNTSIHPRSFKGNNLSLVFVVLNAALQVLITYTPGVQDVFGTGYHDGFVWLRIIGFAIVSFLLMEFEKMVLVPHCSAWGNALLDGLAKCMPSMPACCARGSSGKAADAPAAPKDAQLADSIARKATSSRRLTKDWTAAPAPNGDAGDYKPTPVYNNNERQALAAAAEAAGKPAEAGTGLASADGNAQNGVAAAAISPAGVSVQGAAAPAAPAAGGAAATA